MGDMGEYWRDVAPDMKKRSEQKRAQNRSDSARLLAEEGVNFHSNNRGEHLIVEHHGATFDFWPGTGKWIKRGASKYMRGVRSLLAALHSLKGKP